MTVIERGDLRWADLGPAPGSRPAKRRPVLVVQASPYNRSRLSTAVVAVVTSQVALAAMPGNVLLPAAATGLARDSVVNVTALATLDRREIDEFIGTVGERLMAEVDSGLRRVLGL